MSSRAKPLPPDERRAALVAATLPLITEYGPAVTTRQIAHAAGVAEGTIFGVFPDKDALIRASLAAALDPQPAIRRLASLDPAAGMEDRLIAAVEILQERLAKVFHLVTALGFRGPSDAHPGARSQANAAILEALTEVFARHADQLRSDPSECARRLRLVVFAGSHPRITDENPLSAREIVDLLLNGVTKSPVGADRTPEPSLALATSRTTPGRLTC
ncbi:MAG: hypothetical protein QOI06_136 [Nocardioidaceae bacterium]|jgi:AcrR family transcriptional regulator|nr:hypothetical protein [Nocardioidaceae bacterium]